MPKYFFLHSEAHNWPQPLYHRFTPHAEVVASLDGRQTLSLALNWNNRTSSSPHLPPLLSSATSCLSLKNRGIILSEIPPLTPFGGWGDKRWPGTKERNKEEEEDDWQKGRGRPRTHAYWVTVSLTLNCGLNNNWPVVYLICTPIHPDTQWHLFK